MKDEQGITLIELIASFVILAVLTGVWIVGYSAYMKGASYAHSEKFIKSVSLYDSQNFYTQEGKGGPIS